jgi:hypothetical protein
MWSFELKIGMISKKSGKRTVGRLEDPMRGGSLSDKMESRSKGYCIDNLH